MRAADYPQLAAENPHKKTVTGATAREMWSAFILLNPSISGNDRRYLAIDFAA